MKYLNEKLKSLTTAILAIMFLVAVAVSCGTATKEADDVDEAEGTEQMESDEHPAGGEHPTADEADSTVVEADTTAVEME